MQLYELAAAEKARQDRENAEKGLDVFAGYEVVGVLICPNDRKGFSDAIQIPGRCNGTLSYLSWGDDMTSALTKTFEKVFRARRFKAEEYLKSVGVEL